MTDSSRDPQHVLYWLGPYLDEELTQAMRQYVEGHLDHCLTCRAELDDLRGLSRLLHDHPAPLPRTSADAFAAQVMRHIQTPQRPIWQRFLMQSWRFAPAYLFGLWAFFQAVSWVAGGLMIGLRLFPGFSDLLPGLAQVGGDNNLFLFGLLPWELPQSANSLLMLGSLILIPVLMLLFGGVISLLFSGWLASWLAYRQHRQQNPDAMNIQSGIRVDA